MRERVVLAVDDDPKMRDLLRTALRSETVEVLTAHNGYEALDLTRRLLPDVILLDLHMPQLDGLKTLARLRDASTTRHVPVIMLSADRSAETVSHSYAAGADDYLAKPFALKTLEDKVAHWLGQLSAHVAG